jgi:hypothetical protein
MGQQASTPANANDNGEANKTPSQSQNVAAAVSEAVAKEQTSKCPVGYGNKNEQSEGRCPVRQVNANDKKEVKEAAAASPAVAQQPECPVSYKNKSVYNVSISFRQLLSHIVTISVGLQSED